MDGAVAQRLGERLVHEAVLVEQRQPVEPVAGYGHLEVVAATRTVVHPQLLRVRKRVPQQGFEMLDGHAAMVRPRAYPVAMEEIGLFPLGIVLLPTEQVPLHIFEERYKELIAECLADEQEFGLLFADAEGVREIGTRAGVIEVLARLEDGRMNVVIEGRERFRLVELTRGRSFQTGQVEPFADDDDPAAADSVGRALELFNRLRELTGSDVEVPAADSSQLSFELAARVELPAEAKQELLQEASERIRVDRVGELLVDATVTVERQRRAAERAASNGKVDFS